MNTLLKFLEKLFRKISLFIRYYLVIHNYHTSIKRLKIRNKELFQKDYDKKMLKEYIKKWSVFKHPFSTEQFKIYSLSSGINSANFIPDNIFFWFIEPTLNRLKTNFAYSDKNSYERFYPNECFPKGILRCINNSYYDHNFNLIRSLTRDSLNMLLMDYQEIIYKPSLDSRGGRNIQLFKRTNGDFTSKSGDKLSVEYLNKISNSDFIIQEKIKPHPFYVRFNPSSLNTLRLMTYRSVKTEKIEVVFGILRIGPKGSLVDNLHSGGTAVGISSSGVVNSFGLDADANIIYRPHSNPDIKLGDIGPAFGYDKMVEAVSRVASQVFNFRLISFDICIDSSGTPRIIELNIGNQGSAFLQACNGPLLGDFTDEIIEYCLNNKKMRNHILI
jgi:hypothetical protein